jgi:hypothetical protein
MYSFIICSTRFSSFPKRLWLPCQPGFQKEWDKEYWISNLQSNGEKTVDNTAEAEVATLSKIMTRSRGRRLILYWLLAGLPAVKGKFLDHLLKDLNETFLLGLDEDPTDTELHVEPLLFDGGPADPIGAATTLQGPPRPCKGHPDPIRAAPTQ